MVTPVAAVPDEESFADVANVAVETVREFVVDPVVPVPVVDVLLPLVPVPVVDPVLPLVAVPVVPVPVVPVPVVPVPVVDPVLPLVAVPVVPVPVVLVPVVPVPVVLVPVVPVPVVDVALVTTLDAAAEPVSAPRVELFEPLPRATLSRRSGNPNVDEPLPAP